MDYQDYNELFTGHGVPVELNTPDDFLKIKETLTRIGVSSKHENTLYQSCHLLHKRGHYVIIHFKELFDLDRKPTSIDSNDIARRNKIAQLLEEWGLCKRVFPDKYDEPMASIAQIKIVKNSEKSRWKLCEKYSVGSFKHDGESNRNS